MAASGEELLLRNGLRIHEMPFPPSADRYDGALLARNMEGGFGIKVVIRSGISGTRREVFARWAADEVKRLLDSGTDERWECRSATEQHLWFRRTTILGL